MGNAYADRVIYDRKGEEVCSKFTTVFEERYPDSTFSQRATDIKLEAERAKIFSKGKATRVKKKDMYALQDVANKWKNAGHQDNFSRAAIFRAFDKSTPVLRLFVTSALKCTTQQRNLGMAYFSGILGG